MKYMRHRCHGLYDIYSDNSNLKSLEFETWMSQKCTTCAIIKVHYISL